MKSDTNELCKYVCRKIEEYDLVSENTPTSKAAGTIYLVSYIFNLNISKSDISQTCLTSEVTISKCFGKLIDYYIYLFPDNWLRFLAVDFIHKFAENIDKFYSNDIYQDFLKSSLSLFEKCLKEEIITDNKFVTYLSGGIVYYQLILRNFININIKDVSLLYHMTEEQILEYYEKVKKLISQKHD